MKLEKLDVKKKHLTFLWKKMEMKHPQLYLPPMPDGMLTSEFKCAGPVQYKRMNGVIRGADNNIV